MDTDLLFVLGLVIGAFAFPSIVSAFSEGRSPRTAAILVMIGGGMVAIAVYDRPGAYTIATIPDAFVRVVGRYIN